MTKEEIAAILKNARVKAGLTQIQAAQAIGRKQQTLASWEIGQSQPDANTLFKLFDIYGQSVDDAFGYSKSPSNQKAPAETGEGKYKDYIELLDKLSEEQKMEVKGYLKHLVYENGAAAAAKQINDVG